MNAELVRFDDLRALDDFYSRMSPEYLKDHLSAWPDPAGALRESVMRSGEMCWALEREDGLIVALVGAASLPLDIKLSLPGGRGANLWCVQTAEIGSVQYAFVRKGRELIEELCEHFGTLLCMMSVSYPRILRFMEWCGFVLLPKNRVGNFIWGYKAWA
jgi:hypothetical protein